MCENIMTRFILVMPGETDWSKENRIKGCLDIPLNDRGIKQAAGLAQQLDQYEIDALYSSPLSRSYETAGMIADLKEIKIKKNKDFQELNQGLWQGLLVTEARKRYKKVYTLWEESPLAAAPPQGESIADIKNRVVRVINKLTSKHRNETICIVGHKVVNAIIKSHYLKLDLNKLWQILPDEGTWEVLDISNGQ